MFKSSPFRYCLFLALGCLLAACPPTPEPENDSPKPAVDNEGDLRTTMQQHLDAVSQRDTVTLAATLAPHGKMQLILPGSEITHTAEEFMAYHRAWFQDTTWTFDTKILNASAGDRMGMAVTEVVYREPERNGEPYFNRMIVSYDLEKIDGQWYVVKDHASSVEKSTD